MLAEGKGYHIRVVWSKPEGRQAVSRVFQNYTPLE
jgi:hypothetical protein